MLISIISLIMLVLFISGINTYENVDITYIEEVDTNSSNYGIRVCEIETALENNSIKNNLQISNQLKKLNTTKVKLVLSYGAQLKILKRNLKSHAMKPIFDKSNNPRKKMYIYMVDKDIEMYSTDH